MKIFGERLKQQAMHLGLSSAEAARRAGLAERRFNNYCNDEREPDLATLVRMAQALETTPDLLLGVHDLPERGERETLLDRLSSAARALSQSELEIVTIQTEALSAKLKVLPKG
jgi:transcriptional regulator with XRE-family HTH domain